MKHTIPVIFIVLCMLESLTAQTKHIRIWENTSIRNKSVTLQLFLPDTNLYAGTAVIVCPGGSYSWLDYEMEGTEVAHWLQNEGIAAFVLKYRVQGIFQYITHSRAIFGGHKYPDMLEDIQRAIQLVREGAKQYDIDPGKVGAMGFSAGGHLVMSGACFHATDFIVRQGIRHTVSLRPDFVTPIYPVVSMSHPDTHKRSRRALLGEWKQFSRVMRDSLSLEHHIPNDCPPVFLMNCKDDPVVKYHNSELLDSALSVKKIPHRYIQYHTGGHGFGASNTHGTEESRQWCSEFIKWLKELYKDQEKYD